MRSTRVLLDTNVLVWLFAEKKRHNIGKHARKLIDSSEVYVSPLSYSELAIKTIIGKFKAKPTSSEESERAGLIELPFTHEHTERIYDFQSLARHDPFDRMLLAQALSEDMMFLTGDQALIDLKLTNIVDATL
jgi:PIN domain nuclease of toxin-antitoxin system